MAEIGAGAGSDYPGVIDSNASLEVNSSLPSRTKARAEVPNDLAAAIVAIETTLGVNPQRSLATVVAYLSVQHNADGAHNDAFVVTTSGDQSITGSKTFTRPITAAGMDVGVSGLWGQGLAHASGFVRISGDGTAFATNLALGGRATAGVVPWARLQRDRNRTNNATAITITSSTTLLALAGTIPVSTNDIVLVMARVRMTKGVTGGQSKLEVLNNGSATIQFGLVDTALNDERFHAASTDTEWSLMGIGFVQSGGTAQFFMRASSGGSNSTMGGGQAELAVFVLAGS